MQTAGSEITKNQSMSEMLLKHLWYTTGPQFSNMAVVDGYMLALLQTFQKKEKEWLCDKFSSTEGIN